MIEKKQIKTLHREAMALAEFAIIAKLRGDEEAFVDATTKAFELEREAALLLDNSDQPTRGILLRSAATLAMDCRKFEEAERLIHLALSENVSPIIATECRDLLETVTLSRHLNIRGVELDSLELQLSLAGGAVGFGFIEGSQFVKRVDALEKLIVRTAERKHNLPFRAAGSYSKSDTNELEVWYSIPRAASYAITIRLSKPTRQRFLEFDQLVLPEMIINEVLTCINLFDQGEENALKRAITDETYYNNFVALAKKLAPDGQKIATVGLTSFNQGATSSAVLRQGVHAVWSRRNVNDNSGEMREVAGIVVFAETSKDTFGVQTDLGILEKIKVEKGILNDIVRPYYGDRVVVMVWRTKSGILEFRDIKHDK